MTATAASLLLVASAVGQSPARPANRPDVEERLQRVRNYPRGTIVRAAWQDRRPIPAERDVIEVETEPPTRDKLFRLDSEDAVLRRLEEESRTKDPQLAFLMPGPEDRFDGPDRGTLGPLWYQSRRTGPKRERDPDPPGIMGIQRRKGLHPVGAPAEVAIINESVGTPDMVVSVEVQLGSPESQFGIVVRAQDPAGLRGTGEDADAVDQLDANVYYYVLLSADRVTLGKRAGNRDTRLETASIAPKTSFKLIVAAYRDEITVYRDGIEVLKATDATITGRYAGLYGQLSRQRPTVFDNFSAVRYGGPFLARVFPQSASIFHGPNIHYRPLYFEQAALERYGHHLGNLFQPWLAHSLFLVDVLGAPYSIGRFAPWSVHSGEGYDKPGDIVLPFEVALPPADPAGILTQIGVSALAFSVIP